MTLCCPPARARRFPLPPSRRKSACWFRRGFDTTSTTIPFPHCKRRRSQHADLRVDGGRRKRRARAGGQHKVIQFRFECRRIFFLPYKSVGLFVEREGPCDFTIVNAGGSQDELCL